MKQILFCLVFFGSQILWAQSSECDFPKVWIVDPTSVELQKINPNAQSKVEKLIEANYSLDDLLADSVHFYSDNTLKIFYSTDGKVVTEKGTYKVKKRKFQWTIRGTSKRSYKRKSFGIEAEKDYRCSLQEDGFTLFSSLNKDILKSTDDVIVVGDKIGLHYKAFPK